jgi:hypothetical protein
MKTMLNKVKEQILSKYILFQKKFDYLCAQSINNSKMNGEVLDLTYPKKFICVMSSSYPSKEMNFNEHAQHIANKLNRTPFERMSNLLQEKTIEESRKNFNK